MALTPEELAALQELIAKHNEVPLPQYEAPVGSRLDKSQDPSPADLYDNQAAQYKLKADELDAEAATPRPQPVGVKQHIVEAIRAGMENFGRLGAPGGYYGQEEKRQKEYSDETAAKIQRAKELRGQAQQQEDLGQRATYQADQTANQEGNLEVSRGNLAVNQQQEKRAQQVANRPVGNDIGMGVTRVFTNPDTGAEVPGTRLEGQPKPSAAYNLEVKVVDEGGGKFGYHAFDVRAGGPPQDMGRLGDAPAPQAAGGGAGALPSPVDVTDPKTGLPIKAGYDRRTNTITPATMAGDPTRAPVQNASTGNTNARALVTSEVGVNAAQNLVASMQDTLIRIKSGQSKAIGADDMNLLSSHLAMTFGTVKGARTGRDLIREHVNARDLGDKMQVIMENVLNGSQLSPGQREEFVHLAEQRFDELKRGKQNLQNDFGNVPAPAANTGKTPVVPGGALDRLLNGSGGPR